MVWKKYNRWMADWRDADGKRRRRSFTSKKKAAAYAVRAASRARRKRQSAAQTQDAQDSGGKPPESRTFRRWRDQYLATKTAFTTDWSKANHRIITLLLAHLPHNIRPENLGPQHLSDFRACFRQSTPNTKASYIGIIRAFFSWLKRARLLTQEIDWLWPSSGCRTKARSTTLDPAWEEPIETLAPPIVKLIFMMGRHAGARIGETARYEAQDFHPLSAELTTHSEKGYGDRTNPCPPKLAAYLTDLTAGVQPTQNLTALFTRRRRPANPRSLNNAWADWANKTGLRHLRPHDLRRTLASQLAPHLSTVAMMKFFGWCHPNSVMPYVHLQAKHDPRKALQKAYAELIT